MQPSYLDGSCSSLKFDLEHTSFPTEELVHSCILLEFLATCQRKSDDFFGCCDIGIIQSILPRKYSHILALHRNNLSFE